MLNFLKSLQRDKRGVTSLEYAVLAAIVVAAVVAAGATFNTDLKAAFHSFMTTVKDGGEPTNK